MLGKTVFFSPRMEKNETLRSTQPGLFMNKKLVV